MAKAARVPDKVTDEEAIRHLLRRYVKERDWFMVERMFNELGRIFQTQGDKA